MKDFSKDSFFTFDATMKAPFGLIVAGPSSSGKTTFTCELLQNKNGSISKDFDYIVWFYGQDPPSYPNLIQSGIPIQFVHGLPENIDSYIKPNLNGVCVFDDLMTDVGNSGLIGAFFSQKIHHENISVIFITQKLFSGKRNHSMIYDNSTYLTIFKNPINLSIVDNLARKIMPKNQKTFVKMFEHATEKDHGYLFIDGHQTTPLQAKFRSDILDETQRVFIPSLYY